MLENWKAMRRYRLATRLSAQNRPAEAKALCLEALGLVALRLRPAAGGDGRARTSYRDASLRLTKLIVLGMVAAVSLDLGEEDDARRALREWTAVCAESRNLYPGVFDRGDLIAEEWVRAKLALLERAGGGQGATLERERSSAALRG